MGFFKKFKKFAAAAIKDSAKVVSAGAYNPDTGGINFSPEKMVENQMNGAMMTGQLGELGLVPKEPKLPKAEDPADQEAKARAAANAKMGEEKRGLASTLLGGSLGDDSNIKKKKLLGE